MLKIEKKSVLKNFLFKVSHEYVIYHNSSLRIPLIEAEFRWPQTYHDKYLIYLHQVTVDAAERLNVKCDQTKVNEESYRERVARDTSAARLESAKSLTKPKPLKLDCNSRPMKCATVKCTVSRDRSFYNAVRFWSPN